MAKVTTIYLCDRNKNVDCAGRDYCKNKDYTCHHTTEIKFAKRNRHGKPISELVTVPSTSSFDDHEDAK